MSKCIPICELIFILLTFFNKIPHELWKYCTETVNIVKCVKQIKNAVDKLCLFYTSFVGYRNFEACTMQGDENSEVHTLKTKLVGRKSDLKLNLIDVTHICHLSAKAAVKTSNKSYKSF